MKNSCKILCALVLTAALALSLASCDLSSLFGTPDCGEGNHVWSEDYTSVTPASCGQNETGYYTCTVCEKQGETVEIADTALSHIWSTDHTTATPAECGKNETGYKTCTLCDTKGETEEIPDTALEHTWSEDYTTDAAATCKGNATAYYTCTACEAKGESFEIEGTKLDHVWSETYTIDKAGVCLENSTGHRVCVNCETADVTVELPDTAPGHRWSEDYQIATEASCTNEATGYKICLDCEEIGAVETVPNSMLPHTWSADYTIDTAASCDVNATGHKVCTVCKTADETVTIEGTALAHDFTAEVEKADYKIAETAHDYYKSCKNCGKADPAGSKFTAPHKYDQKVANDDTFVSAATTAAPETYKLSCACGLASETETFGVGYALFAGAGNGIYWKNEGEYTVTKNTWDAVTSDDYSKSSGFSELTVADSVLNAVFANYGNALVANKNLVKGTQHIFETDIMFSNPVLGTAADTRFAAISLTADASNGGLGKAFLIMYVHMILDDAGTPVAAELSAEGGKAQANGYSMATFDLNKWYNLRVIVTETVDESTGKTTTVTYSVYVNGTLACENRTKGTNASLASQKLTGIGFESRGTNYNHKGMTVNFDNTVFGTVNSAPEIPAFAAGTGAYWTKAETAGAKYDYTTLTNDTIKSNITLRSWAFDDSGSAGKLTVADGKLVANNKASWGVWLHKNNSEATTGTKHVYETDIMFSNITTAAGTRVGIVGMLNSSLWSQNKGADSGFFRSYLNTVTDEDGELGMALATASGGNAGNYFVFKADEWYNLRFEAIEVKGESITGFVYINGVKVATITDAAYANYKNGDGTFGGMSFEHGAYAFDITFANTYMGSEQ